MIASGIIMSPSSNLITLYEQALSALTTLSRKRRARPFASAAPANAASGAVSDQTNEIEPEQVSPETLPTVIPQNSTPSLPVSLELMPPLEGISLKLKRSTKDGLTGKPIYMLDARIDASADALALIQKHRLRDRVVYDSAARRKRTAAAVVHLANTRDNTSMFAPPTHQAAGIARSVWHLGRAAVSGTMAALSLRITVDSLLSGVHVECKSMEELADAEDAIRQAKENLENNLHHITSFDGSEEVI